VSSEDLMTVTDSHGASIVLERNPDDRVVGVWIAPPGENDGWSVILGEESSALIAKFLLGGAA
jgi:hypothetical protein